MCLLVCHLIKNQRIVSSKLCHLSSMSHGKLIAIGGSVGVIVLLAAILVSISFSYVEYYEVSGRCFGFTSRLLYYLGLLFVYSFAIISTEGGRYTCCKAQNCLVCAILF